MATYLFPLILEFGLPFDSTGDTGTGSFSTDFLVGFRAFDSFQFGHLAVTVQSRTDALFLIFRQRTKVHSVGFIQKNLHSHSCQ